ncbi:MAG: 50S ribosomal protein L9 [Erysipelotrichaceae bacterium]|jgi:large subunit ribosomal protein L9|nr:50S ribosomal protein L9 [Erysipelotrichaceae bacterium]
MKVILLADVKNVGKKDQVIEVSDGYAVNFLFPRRLAVQMSKKSAEVLETQQEQKRENEAKLVAEAQKLVKVLEDITLEFKVKTGREGKLFGAISAKQITDELLRLYNVDIDKRKFIDKGPFDRLGFYEIRVELHKGVVGKIRLHLVGEEK